MWALGALLSILGSVASNFGVNLQKYSFMKNGQKPKLQQQHYYKQKYWLIGLLTVAFGDHSERHYNLSQLISFYALTSFNIFALSSILCVLLCIGRTRHMNALKHRLNDAYIKYDAICAIVDGIYDDNIIKQQTN